MKKELFVILLSVIFFSCTNPVPDFSEIKNSVIFQKDKNGKIESRLSVFLESNVYGDRIEKIQISTEDGKLTWYIDYPEIFSSGKTKYVGSSHLTLPDNMKFQNGKYSIKAWDYHSNLYESNFEIKIDKEINQKTFLPPYDDFDKTFFLIFDMDEQIIAFREKTKTFNENSLKDNYNKAAFFQEYKYKSSCNYGILFERQML